MSTTITMNANDPNNIQNYSNISNGLPIQPLMPFTGYHQTENSPFLTVNNIGYGCEMKRYEYDLGQQMNNKGDKIIFY